MNAYCDYVERICFLYSCVENNKSSDDCLYDKFCRECNRFTEECERELREYRENYVYEGDSRFDCEDPKFYGYNYD